MVSIMPSMAALSSSWCAARKFFCLPPHDDSSLTQQRTNVSRFRGTESGVPASAKCGEEALSESFWPGPTESLEAMAFGGGFSSWKWQEASWSSLQEKKIMGLQLAFYISGREEGNRCNGRADGHCA